ncbi:MAG: flagellar basal-body rod protein FlgF [Alphaproteobacteria bacterium]
MDASIYIATSLQANLFRDMDVTANNIANLNTAGYQAEKLSFNQYLEEDGETKDAYANEPSSYRDLTPGAMQYTNNSLDFAISGNAYFQVQTPLGVRYTRAGGFQLNEQGSIVTTDGYPVLGADGSEITVPEGTKEVVVNGIGQVGADGQTIGQIGLMSFRNEQGLQRLGNSLYTSSEAPEPSESARVVQGAIESSNVNGVTELVRVMNLTRAVTNSSKFIDTMYNLERKTSDAYTNSQAA